MTRSFPLRLLLLNVSCLALTAQATAAPAKPLPVPDSQAATPQEMKPYAELIEHTDEKIEMVPIPGGKFKMGSPATEKGRKEDEGPQHQVEIGPFWMAKCEITWDSYEIWMADLDIVRRKLAN